MKIDGKWRNVRTLMESILAATTALVAAVFSYAAGLCLDRTVIVFINHYKSGYCIAGEQIVMRAKI
jgi:hypothetical protein